MEAIRNVHYVDALNRDSLGQYKLAVGIAMTNGGISWVGYFE